MGDVELSKSQKLEKALLDPEYRLQLLTKGDPDLMEIINASLINVEFTFRAAAEGMGLQRVIRSLHSSKANHQACHD